MRLILTLVTLVCLSISTQAMAAGQDLYCSSNEVSATLFLRGSKKLFVYRPSNKNYKIVNPYTPGSSQIANTPDYSINMISGNQVLVLVKNSGLEFVLNCR